MRTLRLALIAPVAVLISCGGGSSSTTSEASSTSTVAGTDALQGDGSSSTQISPVVDCKVEFVSIDPWTPTLWDAAGYCWGADRKVIVDIIIEMNPQIDPMNLRWNQIIKLPQDYSRYEANRTRRYKVGDTGPGGGVIVYVDLVGFDNSSGGDTSIGVMCLTGTCHYLEMAPTEIVGHYLFDEARLAAESLSTATADNWVLPSKDALNELCKYVFGDTKNVICNDNGRGGVSLSLSGFSNHLGYWSISTSGGDNCTLISTQSFRDGSQSEDCPNNGYYGVYPVRAF